MDLHIISHYDNQSRVIKIFEGFEFDNVTVNGSFKQVIERLRLNPRGCIIAKDSSTTLLTPELLKNIINWFLSTVSDFDILWLAKWYDSCIHHEVIKEDSKGVKIVRTFSVFGSQCLLVSPSGVEKLIRLSFNDVSENLVLNSEVRNRRIKAFAIQPPPIQFDVSFVLNASLEYSKTRDCADPTGTIHQSRQKNLGLYFFIIIGIIISLIIVLKFNIYPYIR